MQWKKYIQQPNLFGTAAVLIGLALLGLFISRTADRPDIRERDLVKARVIEIVSERQNEAGVLEQIVRIETLDSAWRRGEIINDFVPVAVGDTIFVRKSLGGTPEGSFQIVDISRERGIFWLAGLFVVVILAVAGRKGLYALAGLVATFIVIFGIMFPRIMSGDRPFVIGVFGSLLIVLVTLYISHGINRKSLAALAGIFVTLIFAGVLAAQTVSSLRFSGGASEEALLLSFESGVGINLVGLVVIGIIIAAVGVLDDVAVTQAASVYALGSTNLALRGWTLFKQAMVIGKDHVSAVINTLVLAYTGAALPLVLLLWSRQLPFAYMISNEIIAEEIVRTLISTSALVLVVPITTAIAVLSISTNK